MDFDMGALIQVMRRAGRVALSVEELHPHAKGASDYVTDVDRAVDAFLIRELPRLVPGRMYTEETPIDPGEYPGNTWVVDPIDGTTNVMFGLNLSAISAALVTDGCVRAGAIYNPFNGELFHAQKGGGAFLNGQSIRVSDTRDLADALISFELGPCAKGQQAGYLARVTALHQASSGVRLLGSAALDLCYLAAGRLSACVFDAIHPWDYAAGRLILEEAGGMATDCEGRPLVMRGRVRSMMATNGHLQEAVLEIMRGFAWE
jgi:myo-inositol-1(or 4)-monophosphatase